LAPVARLTPTSLQPVSPALALLSDVAAHLAAGGPIEDALHKVLELLRRALTAGDCAIWALAPAGLTRACGVGDGATTDTEISALLEAGELSNDRTVMARLIAGERLLGVLVLRVERTLDSEERIVLATIADLLAPAIANAEHAQQMAIEVRLRTQQIEEQRRFTEKIIDSLPVGLYVIDREYRIHAWNRKRETGIQGVSREEAIGRTIFEILHRQPAELLRGEFDEVFATGKLSTFQMESSATGDLRTFRISKIPMRVDDMNVTHVITIGEDMTDWRQAQDRIAQAEKLAAIGQLAAGVMHEVNNPLATIGACAESMSLRLEEQHADASLRQGFSDYLRIIDTEVHRCKRIIDGLLDFSRPKAATKVAVDVNAVLEETLFLLKHHERFKRMSVVRELDRETTPLAHGNAEQLIQVFMALLLNAMDAMNGRGAILVRTRRGRPGEEPVVVEIADEGHGIPRGEMTKIFEPFYTSKPPGRGTGLGLSICYSIVADHEGRIEVDSHLGKGTTFRVLLPSANIEGEGKA
jgi:two-component system NtrC family sensor kinase